MTYHASQKLLAEVDRVKGLQAYMARDPITAAAVAATINTGHSYAHQVLGYMVDTGLVEKKKKSGRVVYIRTQSNAMPFNWRTDDSVYTDEYTPRWY